MSVWITFIAIISSNTLSSIAIARPMKYPGKFYEVKIHDQNNKSYEHLFYISIYIETIS